MNPETVRQNFSSIIYDVNDDVVRESGERHEQDYMPRNFSIKCIKISSFIAGVITTLLLTTIILVSTSTHRLHERDDSENAHNSAAEAIDISGHLIVGTEKNLWIVNHTNNANHLILDVNTSARVDLFDYDYSKKTIIWIDKNTKEFKFLWHDHDVQRFSRKLKPEAFRIDHITGNLYVIDNAAETLNVINTQSGFCGIVVSQIVNPYDLVLDPSEGIMFIASKHHSISKVDMNGDNLELFVNSSSVSALAIDLSLKNLYFALDFTSIESVNYMGTGRVTITKVSTAITSLTMYDQSLYWTGESLLWTCDIKKNTYGYYCKNGNRAHHSYIRNPKIVRSYECQERIARRDPCKDAGCRHLCLLIPADENRQSTSAKYSCACAIGWELEQDGKSCKIVDEYLMYALGIYMRARNLDPTKQSFIDVVYPTKFQADSLKLKHGIDFDYDRQGDRLFFSDDYNIYVMTSFRSDDAEQNELVSVDRGHYSIKDIAYDWLSGYLYYVKMSMTGNDNHQIVALRYTTDKSLLIERTLQALSRTDSRGRNCPHSLIVLPNANTLFYTDYKSGTNNIQKLSIFQDNTYELRHLPYTNTHRTLAIDYEESRLYFPSEISNNCKITSMNYNGSDEKIIYETQIPRAHSIYVYQEWLFISNEINIWRLDKTNGAGIVQMIKNSDSHILSAMRIVSSTIQTMNTDNPCAFNNGGCKHFCFASFKNKECRCSNNIQNIYTTFC